VFLKREIVMKKLITQYVTLLFLVFNYTAFATGIFDKNFTGTQKEYYANGTQKYQVNVVKGQKQGLETFWYPNGKKNIETNYVNDKEDGIWQQWYANKARG
jgi:MORN repeat variant